MNHKKKLTRGFFSACILWYWCVLPKPQCFLPKREYLSPRLYGVTIHNNTIWNKSATKTWQLTSITYIY